MKAAVPHGHEPLRILFTNTTLEGWTGTELYIRDVALGLKARGHHPMVYSPRLGQPAATLREHGVPVVSDLHQLQEVPELIHGQHHLETMAALLHFRTVPAVGFCHGIGPWEEQPPLFPRIFRYVAVSEPCRQRVLDAGIPASSVTLIRNFVDLARFSRRGPLPERPLKALVFSNHASAETFLPLVERACRERGMAVDVVGARSGNPSATPEQILGRYDLVFSRGRAALESMAVGAAVIACDIEGLGPMVTTENLESLRRLNLGAKALTQAITVDGLLAEIDRYDAGDAVQVTQEIREQASLDSALDQLLTVYGQALADGRTYRAEPEKEDEAASCYLAWVSRTLREQLDPEREQYRLIQATMAEERERLEQLTRRQAEDIERFTGTMTWKMVQGLDRIPLARRLYQSVAQRPRAPSRKNGEPRVLALLAVRNGMRFLPGYFENLPPHVDGIVALDDASDDGSGEFLRAQPSLLKLLSSRGEPTDHWDEPTNRRRLIEAAWAFNPDWLLAVDVDERLEKDFRTRALRELERAAHEGLAAYDLVLRELWDQPDRYRVDGVWGQKRVARLFRADPNREFDERAFHGAWAPHTARGPDGRFPLADLLLYHLAMVHPEDRVARRDKYKRLDPDNRWQAIGYDYLTDETGLQLDPLPPGREYHPLGHGN